jgi:gamma-glutamyltranspeptidase/glutathione hydrolase
MMRIRRLAAALALSALLLAAREPVRARRAMVAAQEPHATGAGVAVLKSGGNAVDAAVAAAFALAVTHPVAGNLGGGGFLLVQFSGGRATFIDFRERAPEAASRDMYLDPQGNLTDASVIGWRAAGVPGTVRGLELAHKKFGRRPWDELLKPAIELASRGFELSFAQARSLRGAEKLLGRFPESRRIFLNGGRYFEPGERLYQPELAATLQRIARDGSRDFYEGETARLLAKAVQANGGHITAEDLRRYEAVERVPLKGAYKGYEIVTAPPPSSGGVGLLQMLGVLEPAGYEKAGAGSAATIHYVAEAMRRFFADRSRHLADPGFHKVPIAGLLDPAYIGRLRASIDPARATPSSEIHAGSFPPEPAETTHLSILDAEGNAAALTYTINGGYGSGVTVPGLGFLLNNEMDDFSAKPGAPNLFGLIQGEANAIQPLKRPVSSMTPAILTRRGRPVLVIGAPGGSRIITGVLQVILNVVDFGMNVQRAIDEPRFHHQWQPDKLYLEDGFSPDTIGLLRSRGHAIDRIPNVAVVEAIAVRDGWLEGGSDGRGQGKAAGY